MLHRREPFNLQIGKIVIIIHEKEVCWTFDYFKESIIQKGSQSINSSSSFT